MSRPHPAYPSRPLLRPGAWVCRRADGHLQVGLEQRIALVAPDTAAVRAVLDGLRAGSPPLHPSSLPPAVARFCVDLLDRERRWRPFLTDRRRRDRRHRIRARGAGERGRIADPHAGRVVKLAPRIGH